MFLLWVLGLLLYILVYPSVSSLIEFRFGGGLTVVGGLLFAWVCFAMYTERGIVGMSMKLHMNPFLMLFITNRSVFIHSSWVPRTEVRNHGVHFLGTDGQFMAELRM